MKLDEFEQFLGVKIAALIAGGVGGIVQLSINPKLSLTGAIASVFCGAVCAGYLGPVVSAGLVAWLPQQAEGALNFLIGLLGMQLVAKLYTVAREMSADDFKALIRRIFNLDKNK